MAESHAVVLDDVTVRVPRRSEAILREVSLQIAPGEQVLVLGASGSGKSSVLRTISGVVPHSVNAVLTGSVQVAGHSQVPVVELSRHVGVLPQDPSAAVCMPDVEQELALPLENRAVSPGQIGPAVTEALDMVGATHLRERATSHLSGGESQRIALAAALVGRPEVLLLDEPTSMLDPAGVTEVRRALGRAVEHHRPSVLLVEHRLDDLAGVRGVSGLPPRAVVMDGARVVADGPTEQVLREHAAALREAGSWLPLEAELYALTGTAGGLAAPENVAFLEDLATEDGARRLDPLPSPGPTVLAARGITVARPAGGRSDPVLERVDLELRRGEVVALLGPNGVGKTSLLLTLAGLLRPGHGVVEGARPGMVFQNAEHQFVAHTVREEIAHGLPAPADERVDQALAAHRLEHLADQNPFRLSGGEQRRVSLAAMLAHERPCLLADEPTLGLDRRATLATIDALRAAADQGGAVLFATHDLRTALTLADRAVVLAHGGVVADGPVESVLSDQDVLEQAGLVLPPVVAWLLACAPQAARRALTRLDTVRPQAVTGGRR